MTFSSESMADTNLVRFGEFELDLRRRLLLREGAPVRISPKAFQLLTVLVDRYPAAVSKAELHDAIWPDTFVSETTLAGLAAELRAAVADDARNPAVIRTVHGFGYAFVGDPIRETEPPATTPFRVVVLGREVALQRGENVIGRAAEASIVIDDASVSRLHASITVTTEARVNDLASKNGTFVNGERVTEPRLLQNRDVIAVGVITITFHSSGGAESTMTVQLA